jgi:transcriptional regulator with XRE-family HTH domain
MQVDPVKQRAGQFRPILLDLLRRAGAFALVAGTVEAADKREDNNLEISIHKEISLSPALPEDDTPGGHIRRARLEKNMMLVDLAAATGLSFVSLRLAEQNKTSVSPSNLRKLSEALGVSIANLGCFENLSEHTLGQQIKSTAVSWVQHKRVRKENRGKRSNDLVV